MSTKTINTILNLKDQFSGKFKQIANQTKQQTRQMKLLNNNISTFKKTAVGSFASVAKGAVALGVAFAGVSAAAATVDSSMQFIKDYGSSMTNLQVATGATSQELADMKSQIKDLYKMNMGESWSDLANAMTLAKQVTGQTGDELKQTTGLAVAYRDVFGEDIAESIKASDTLMKNFGITSAEAYNLLAQGAQQGLNKSGDLLDTANEYGVYFKTLGFNANEMFDMFSAGAEQGAFNLDKVADSVKEFGIRIKDDSKSTKEALSALGFNADQMMQIFANGGEGAKNSFKKVVEAINSLNDPVAKNTIGVQLFGTQFEDMEKDVIAALSTARNQFDMTRDTMGEINKIKYDSPMQAFKGIGRLIETSVLLPIADKLMPKLNEFANWFTENTPSIQEGIDKAFNIGGKFIDSFAKSLSWAKDNANWLIPVVAGLTGAIVAQKVIGTISNLYKTWTTVTKGLTIAQIALTVASNMSPFGWIATAIGLVILAGVALWQNWDTVKAKAVSLWQWLTEAWTNIKTATVNAFSGVADKIKDTFGAIVGFIKTPINAVIDMINGMIDNINGMSFQVPDWVPKIGGETVGVNIPKIPNFELGTSYFKGGLARINERGGEIVNLPGGSQVIPADKSEALINNASKRDIKIEIIVQGDLIGEEEQINRIMNKVVRKLDLTLSNT